MAHVWIVWEGDDPSALRIAKVFDSAVSAEFYERGSRAPVCIVHRYDVED